METQSEYVLDLDQFEMDLITLVAELRVDENQYADPSARQEAYLRTGKRLGFVGKGG
jgi:hypothetical protein